MGTVTMHWYDTDTVFAISLVQKESTISKTQQQILCTANHKMANNDLVTTVMYLLYKSYLLSN